MHTHTHTHKDTRILGLSSAYAQEYDDTNILGADQT